MKRRASVKGTQIEKTMQRMKSLSKKAPSRSGSIKSKRPKPTSQISPDIRRGGPLPIFSGSKKSVFDQADALK